MRLVKMYLYYLFQLVYDLYIKFLYLNIHELPKLNKIKIYIKKPVLKKKLFLINILYIIFLSQQLPFINLKKELSSKYSSQSLYVNLNKYNKYLFLDSLINFYLPQIVNFKKVSKTYFNSDSFFYKLKNNTIQYDKNKLKYNQVKKNFNLQIKYNTKLEIISKIMTNLYLIPIYK